MTSDDRPWETGATEDERWEGYLIPGTHILRNLSPRPLQSVAALRAFEDSHVRSRLIELRMEPIEGNYDTEHWRAIHRHLFQDVYAWAGDLRTVNISKGKFFVAPEHIRGAVDDMARALAEENHLKQLSPLRFADRLTDYYHIRVGRATGARSGRSGTSWPATPATVSTGARARSRNATTRPRSRPARTTTLSRCAR